MNRPEPIFNWMHQGTIFARRLADNVELRLEDGGSTHKWILFRPWEPMVLEVDSFFVNKPFHHPESRLAAERWADEKYPPTARGSPS